MCLWCKYTKCKYCNEPIKHKNYDYCDKVCEFYDVYQDSFKTIDSSQHRYIYDM